MMATATDRLNDFISRQPGDANHAAVREIVLRGIRGRCLDKSSEEANALAQSAVEEFYLRQKRGE
jgi:hypothetical protein